MGKDTKDFFARKSEWARVKDELLSCYLKPYTAKTLHTGNPLLYADCFAGKGRFDDGEDGSPLIACKIIDECVASSNASNPRVEKMLIEKQYARDLKSVLAGYRNVDVHSGPYSDLPGMLEPLYESGVNLFLYIDPFGIADLDMSFFDSIVRRFPSVELLLNLNSFGFFREACRVFGLEFGNNGELDDIVERNPWMERRPGDSEERLSTIAGGDYWTRIVERYKESEIDGFEAEQAFASQYCERLMQSFNYSQHFPIRVKEGNRPKYRMVHATNHADGAVLMYDTMVKRKEILLADLQRGGQLSLFDETAENEIIDYNLLMSRFESHVLSYSANTPDSEVLAQFVVREGVSCPMSEFRRALRDMEQSGAVVITRTPAHGEKGRPTSFMASHGGKKLVIRRA